MFALLGQVRIKPGYEEETAAMAREHGPALVSGMSGSRGAYWVRPVRGADNTIQHSLWLFDTEAEAHAAEKVFSALREMPDAPAVFVSADVCEVISQT